ncbi:hypothetical protein N7495_008571 [Penicillium taxi]|uniref:uncharacterized protein n=1 Tax=Penicillium taxi TaxID=168475 RepID=UPI002544DA4E|nr:uncharacterized protein N7495_008571 [Penicillium taxi]KAJ5888530.1 hypothetical protein N7495_008571 [Penicillium taxi]
MHTSFLILLGLTGSTLASCPYSYDKVMKDEEQANLRADTTFSVPSANPCVDVPSTVSKITGKKGVLLMNRLSPGTSELFIANADFSNERPLLAHPVYEYHASFSPDGSWISFTGERNGDGNSDIYRVRTDGSQLQELVASPAVEDSVVISPNGTLAAYVSTENTHTANIWILDLKTGDKWNVTDILSIQRATNLSLMHGYFRPAWSPDGEWIAFSSDRNTLWDGHGKEGYLGHNGWEHTQELSIYAIRPDGMEFRQVVAKPFHCLGSPKWSPDGRRIIYYEMTREATWHSHRPESIATANSTIVSVDFATGKDRHVEVEGSGIKVFPQYINNNTIGYLLKGGIKHGVYMTNGTYVSNMVRSPDWSPDGKYVIYEKISWSVRPLYKSLYSWDQDWDYRFTDVFPQLSSKNQIAITANQLANSTIITYNTRGKNWSVVYDARGTGLIDTAMAAIGLSGAFQPSWSPDGEWLVFGVGTWFEAREKFGGWILRSTKNGSRLEALTHSSYNILNSSLLNTGYPSYSHDGKMIVYRVWGATTSESGNKAELGLRVLDLETRKITQITDKWDNLPAFSPTGERILFTRKVSKTNYDICTVLSDGTDLQVLTSSGANDAHGVWTADGRILWSTGMFGFQYESALYDDIFQPYGQIMIMNADGSNKQVLTNSIWEDSMPLFLPNSIL